MKQSNNTHAIIARYQFLENYGAHCWDGKGECPQHWKFKGGTDIVIADDVTLQDWVCNMNAYREQALEQEVRDSDDIGRWLIDVICVPMGKKAERAVNDFIANLEDHERSDMEYARFLFDCDHQWDSVRPNDRRTGRG